MIQALLEPVKAFFMGDEAVLYSRLLAADYNVVSLYGAGDFGKELLYLINQDQKLSVKNIFDKNAQHFPMELEGIKVLPPEEITQLNDGDVLVIASKAFKQAMLETAEELIQNKNIHIVSL